MNVSDYWREQSRKRRTKARATGRCIICMTRDARPGRVTCERCCAAATAATKRRRFERRTPEQVPVEAGERIPA
jgi:hypothetical protein